MYAQVMPYPGQFIRLVIIGSLYDDIFNTTVSIVPSALGELGMPIVNQATLDAVASDVEAWWTAAVGSGGIGPISHAVLTSIKLNRLDTAGHYADPIAMEHVYPTPIPGAYTGNFPPQLATVATLRTSLARGRGSKGRMFLPPNQAYGTFDTSGRLTASAALAVAQGVKGLFDRLNASYAGIGRVGVASDAGTGKFEHVTQVSVGRTVDTMRSRRSTLVEDYQTVTI